MKLSSRAFAWEVCPHRHIPFVDITASPLAVERRIREWAEEQFDMWVRYVMGKSACSPYRPEANFFAAWQTAVHTVGGAKALRAILADLSTIRKEAEIAPDAAPRWQEFIEEFLDPSIRALEEATRDSEPA